MNPVILLTATLRWPLAARMAMRLRQAGAHVVAHCPRGHPLECTLAVARCYRHSELSPESALARSIAEARPDFIVPCDDRAVLDLMALAGRNGPERALIEKSLGSPEACAMATARAEIMALARSCGVRAPRTASIADEAELRRDCRTRALPAVLKLDQTWGGEGVWVAETEDAAVAALRSALLPLPWRRVFSQWLLHGDGSAWQRRRQSRKPALSLQDYVPGRAGNRAVFCWRGQVLAGISVEVLHSRGARGPATVVRVIDHPEMSQAAERLVRRLGVSGLWGFDFMLDADGCAHLIEVNPRATPVAQLAVEGQSMLATALCRALSGDFTPLPQSPQAGAVIAMFPDEWRRDPASPYLGKGCLDVPWEEPALVMDCLQPPWAERGLLALLRRRLRREAPPADTARMLAGVLPARELRGLAPNA